MPFTIVYPGPGSCAEMQNHKGHLQTTQHVNWTSNYWICESSMGLEGGAFDLIFDPSNPHKVVLDLDMWRGPKMRGWELAMFWALVFVCHEGNPVWSQYLGSPIQPLKVVLALNQCSKPSVGGYNVGMLFLMMCSLWWRPVLISNKSPLEVVW